MGAGLNQQPWTADSPGQPPVITAQPLDLSTTPGLTATFSVTVTGPGPFQYQWRFNGTNIVGATNATLVLSSVDSSNQGVYSVLVNNGSSAVLSAGAILTVFNLAVTGQWDFDQGDLRATVGADLEYIGDTAAITSFPILNINGQLAGALAFGSNSFNQGFYMRHGAKPNGSGHFINQYTLIIDIIFPAQSSGLCRAPSQTSPSTRAGYSAELSVGHG